MRVSPAETLQHTTDPWLHKPTPLAVHAGGFKHLRPIVWVIEAHVSHRIKKGNSYSFSHNAEKKNLISWNLHLHLRMFFCHQNMTFYLNIQLFLMNCWVLYLAILHVYLSDLNSGLTELLVWRPGTIVFSSRATKLYRGLSFSCIKFKAVKTCKYIKW